MTYDAGLAIDLGSATIPDDVQVILCAGYDTVGRGAMKLCSTTPQSYYELQAGGPTQPPAAAKPQWIFASNGGTRYWRLAETLPDDTMLGSNASATVAYDAASGDTTATGLADNTSIQAGIDRAIYWHQYNGGATVRLPDLGIRAIDDTVQLGYDGYNTITIEGERYRGATGEGTVVAGIFARFDDRPALNVQGARTSEVRNLALIGINYGWLIHQFLPPNTGAASIPDRSKRANWWGKLRPYTQDTRCCPYAGVTVDAYSGVNPADQTPPKAGYPVVAYPSWFGNYAQYGRGASSQVTFDRVQSTGFEVGFIVQPNVMPGASNGDFQRFCEVDGSYNVVGLSISHPDARVIAIERSQFHFCHTAIDAVTYGTRSANFNAHFIGTSFDNCYQIFNVDLRTGVQQLTPSIILINAYCEATYAIGKVLQSADASSSAIGAWRAENSQFGFTLHSAEYYPVYHLDGQGQIPCAFENCSIEGTGGVLVVNGILTATNMSLTANGPSPFEVGTSAGAVAFSFLAGLWAPVSEDVSVRPMVWFDFAGNPFSHRRLTSDRFDRRGGGTRGDVGSPIPWFVRTLDMGGYALPIAAAPSIQLDRSIYNLQPLAGGAPNARTFAVATGWLPDTSDISYYVYPGDIVRDDETGVLFYVSGINGGQGPGLIGLDLRQVTAVRQNGDGFDVDPNTPFATTTGTLTFFCARRVYPAKSRHLMMSTVAGSSTAKLVEYRTSVLPADELGTAAAPVIQAGDYVIRGAQPQAVELFPNGRLTAVNYASGEITFDTPATQSGVWEAPLFVRAR